MVIFRTHDKILIFLILFGISVSILGYPLYGIMFEAGIFCGVLWGLYE